MLGELRGKNTQNDLYRAACTAQARAWPTVQRMWCLLSIPAVPDWHVVVWPADWCLFGFAMERRQRRLPVRSARAAESDAATQLAVGTAPHCDTGGSCACARRSTRHRGGPWLRQQPGRGLSAGRAALALVHKRAAIRLDSPAARIVRQWLSGGPEDEQALPGRNQLFLLSSTKRNE